MKTTKILEVYTNGEFVLYITKKMFILLINALYRLSEVYGHTLVNQKAVGVLAKRLNDAFDGVGKGTIRVYHATADTTMLDYENREFIIEINRRDFGDMLDAIEYLNENTDPDDNNVETIEILFHWINVAFCRCASFGRIVIR